MFERFTDRARRVLVLAQEEAKGLHHNYIGTEHILLGLVHPRLIREQGQPGGSDVACPGALPWLRVGCDSSIQLAVEG